MKIRRTIPVLLVVIFLLAACSPSVRPTTVAPTAAPTSTTAILVTSAPQTSTTGTASPGDAPTQAATAGETPGTLKGVLIGKESGQPLSDAVVRLAKVTRQGDQGMFVLDAGRSPAARTDASGNFTMDNVPPAEYVLMLQIAEGIYTVAKDDAGKPLTWTVESGKVTDTSRVEVATTVP